MLGIGIMSYTNLPFGTPAPLESKNLGEVSSEYNTILEKLKQSSRNYNICTSFDCITSPKVFRIGNISKHKPENGIFLLDNTANNANKKYVKCTIIKNIIYGSVTYTITFAHTFAYTTMTVPLTHNISKIDFNNLCKHRIIVLPNDKPSNAPVGSANPHTVQPGGRRRSAKRRHRKQKSTRRHTKHR